ncbi:uncharacterized protein LOC126853263 [Cataglyphis hispanica]|uniref:uncharacterized protein LOC126853263 n=1 Tax=Cataglyphis hispanica TaxID=1086592 RepID=UPI00217FF884|nr:uncharacterized protein LOC126853263 [Cataglyphis hispanica]
MERKSGGEARPKIEIVRVSSIERSNFRPLDGVQLRATYSHVRVGTYCPEPEAASGPTAENKPPIEQTRRFKKNLGPVSRLLRRRHHATCLATKSCDNIYSVNRNSNSLDWRVGQNANEQELQARQSSSLDWRVGRSVTFGSNQLHWRNATRSAEQLSRSAPLTSDHLQTPSTRSKLVSLLRRLSPRLSRPGSKGSLQSSPTICPWIQVEYSTESIEGGRREESQESDVSFQQELQLNELRKRMAGIASTSQVTSKTAVKDGVAGQPNLPRPRIQVQEPETTECNHRRAVHEDRVDEERRASGQTRGGGEVAGLEDIDDSCVATVTSSVPGAGGIRSHRHIRPLSLAVQPLNYHRLDPDQRPSATIGARHHPNMTSQESIGSCSLDVDRSASDRSENTVDSVSEKTLHSLNLSACNGEPVSSPENLANGSSETLQKSHLTPDEKKLNVSNVCGSPESEQVTAAKKPSYLGLACSISGYSGITRYDSKLREGFRSRDSSPGTRLITRDTSPAGFRSNENLSVPTPQYPPKSQSISPLAMDRQNGFTNGMKEECKVETYMESRSSISICQGYSEVDKGVSLHTTFPDLSPIRMSTSATKRSPGLSQMMSCGQQNKSYSTGFSSPKQDVANLSDTSFSDASILNGSTAEVESQVINTSSSSEKSFIQQRVERLYGPGALAQGFFYKRSTTKLNTSDSNFNKSSNNNNMSADNANMEESLKNLPVLRHLRPEFRAQLPVVGSRKLTDGTEQVIKSLQRVTPTRKTEQKTPTNLQNSITRIPITIEDDAPKRDTSNKSISDQQLAAPKVVLPVLEPSTSLTNIAKQTQETEKVIEEKDGHYFMKLLKQETDRLLSLAASAEAELASGDTVALPEEAAGKLRSAAGKAKLLTSQKMQQFAGLCQKNINQVPGEEFPTTNEDLAGFWDMVMLQVVQVNELFDQIEKLRTSQWQEVVLDKKAAAASQQNGKRRVISVHKAKPTANSEANKKAREAREQARRQMIEERRRAMRSNAQKIDNSVEIFAPET